MRGFWIYLFLFLMFGCAQSQKSKEPIVLKETLNEVKFSKKMVNQLKRNAVQNDYLISSMDLEAGIIQLEPYDFLVERGVLSIAWPVRAKANILSMENSIQISILFECQYGSVTSGSKNWSGCYNGDVQVKEQLLKKGKEMIDDLSKGLE